VLLLQNGISRRVAVEETSVSVHATKVVLQARNLATSATGSKTFAPSFAGGLYTV